MLVRVKGNKTNKKMPATQIDNLKVSLHEDGVVWTRTSQPGVLGASDHP